MELKYGELSKLLSDIRKHQKSGKIRLSFLKIHPKKGKYTIKTN